MMRVLAALVLVCALAAPAEAKQHRSAKVGREFQLVHHCPSTGSEYGPCPGYIKDHIVPLCAGGADAVDNLQWQTGAEAAAKDKLEWAECRAIKRRS